MGNAMKRWFALILLGGVLVAGVLVGLQRQFIYFPGSSLPPPPDGITAVTTTTEDGLVLTGWLARRESDEPLLLVFHGNAGTVADRLPLAEALGPHGVAVLLTGYRGYGGNPGTPSEEGFAQDAVAWQSWARANHDGPLAYLGESIGTGVATRLAVTHPPRAVVLRSPFTSLVDVGQTHYPWLPLRWLLQDRYGVAERIGQVQAPTLVVAGEADQIVPVSQSRAVFQAATQPKQWLEVTDATHNHPALLNGEEMVNAIVMLLRR